MKDEDIIGQEFEGVEFEDVPNMPFTHRFHKPFIGKTGIVLHIHKSYPHLCLVRFNHVIGTKKEIHFPVAVVKQQIEDRIPIDLDDLFNQIKSL